MNKFLYILFFCLSFSFLHSQSITKNPGDFKSIKVYDRLSVQLIPSETAKIEIKGLKSSDVEVVNKNGVLILRMPFLKLLKGESLDVDVHYVSLESIDASEGSIIRGNSLLEAINFKVNVKEGSEVSLNLKNIKTSINVSSGGILNLKGTTENQDILIKAGGELEAKNFVSKQTTISLNAGGNADVNATDFVEAKVRAGGRIYIHGKPKQIDKKIIIGGDIIEAP